MKVNNNYKRKKLNWNKSRIKSRIKKVISKVMKKIKK